MKVDIYDNNQGLNAHYSASQEGHLGNVQLPLARGANGVASAHDVATPSCHTGIVGILRPHLISLLKQQQLIKETTTNNQKDN